VSEASEQKAKDKFAAKLIAAMQRNGAIKPGQTATYDATEFRVRIGDGQILNFGNFYAEYRRHGFFARRKAFRFIAAQLAAVSEVPEVSKDFGAAVANILPRLRERAFWDIAARELPASKDGKGNVPAPPLRIMYDVLAGELVFDTPQAVMSLSSDRFDEWGKTFDETWLFAVDNLKKISHKEFETTKSGLYLSDWQDSHDATRLMLTDNIRKLAVKGHHLAMIPNRDLLMIADSNNEAALLEMAARTRALMDQPRFMTATVFRLVGDQWRPHQFAQSHPLRFAFEQLDRRYLVQCYSQQKDGLQSEVGEELFVAKQTAFVRKGDDEEAFLTYCVWTKTVVSLLPQSDFVIFIELDDDKATPVKVSWADAMSIAGELMKPYGVFPERYRVDEFPDAVKLQQLRNIADASEAAERSE
jgi:hypothetical protein